MLGLFVAPLEVWNSSINLRGPKKKLCHNDSSLTFCTFQQSEKGWMRTEGTEVSKQWSTLIF